MKKYLKLSGMLLAGVLFFASCEEETPAPTATFTSTVTSNVVVFAVTATDATTYEWNFGDASALSTIENPTHTYSEYGRNYTVTLKVTGPGGEITVTNTVTIPAMTKMEMLTGGAAAANGKKWKISSSHAVKMALPDAAMTVGDEYPAGVLTMLGYTTVYTDEWVFFNNKNYNIIPKGTGVMAGLAYCLVNAIPNAPPSADAAGAGLTLLTPFTVPTGMTFTLNESKNLTIEATADGVSMTPVTYSNVMTLSFSTGAFLGIKDFVSECIIQELTATTMRVAFFDSIVPPGAPQEGKTSNILIFTLVVVP